jgi:hypothetical protein
MTNRPDKPIEGTIVGDAIAVKPNAFIENGIKVNCITRVGANGEKNGKPYILSARIYVLSNKFWFKTFYNRNVTK